MRAALSLVMLLALPSAAAAADRPGVLATIGMIGDLAAGVAGECAAVSTLMGPGVDPHLYRATPADVRAMDRADLVLYLGLGLEGQLAEVLGRFAARKPVVAVGAALPQDELAAGDGVDPHVWMDPGLWRQTLPALAGALTGLTPDCAGPIAANAERIGAELDALDRWVADSIGALPEPARVLVTAHDAFGYYGRAYGLRLVAIQGLSTESEASVADIAGTARLVAEAGVPAVFVESTINPRTIQAMIAAARDLGHDLAVGGSLYSDAMGAEGTAEGTYIGMIHANTRAIVTALGGMPAPLPAELAGWAAHWGVTE
ncbi:metal ABC transporter solute-binding protein, Zn/Mn family [Ruixingdingia sedimenti]|uniref:Zinc ABC transporter substrate-binding protein n=1 Tax=Ruixingdingia sedimenti TaxID=3073604 RepID=A0ABU1F8Q0_9RHOB|nr:zinc ABC transporter substrate-binding protein [Xinfangfangia sp. LG-4]MDR5653247.1 zinc ABC transporter substrate-binding protein [Xinfangfangia sp. LG-4]